MPQPNISVVVPSHNRPVRLLWLLDALAEQTLPPEQWEVVVAHDSTDGQTERLLDEHPLAAAGVLRALRLEPTRANSASRLRNAGWRAARSAVIAFTDDDCRPPVDWVERALASARRHPGTIVQGMTRDDPEEVVEFHGVHWHRQRITPPTPNAETCNIVYPRAVLEMVGGFTEDPPLAVGEDTDLALRARAQGTPYVGDRDVLTWHSVEASRLTRRARGLWRWSDLAWLIKHHPEQRRTLFFGVFWKRTHVWLPFALLGFARSWRSPLWLLLVIPWYLVGAPQRGHDPRGRMREITEVPGRLAYDTIEFAAVARGSVKHRSLVL